ncbi:MAG: hypothetical protein PHN49_03180 [Candidatus Omnitrophica bacterium]|nr:hypothetical protein [Candidatus Omnitrophota bacterium]MDD5670623.1 hypothetical protein [Candidatus Omnitrophota bacterium]
MDKAIWVSIAALGAAVGLGVGILLGAWLGQSGAMGWLRAVLRTPLVILKSPGQIKNQWKIWGEWRARRKMNRIRYRNRMKELRDRIKGYRSEIRKTNAEMRHARRQYYEAE